VLHRLFRVVGRSALLITASVTVAGAANMAVKAPPPAPPPAVSTWTGLYVGINGGGDWGHTSWTYANGAPAPHDASGGLFGGTIGYNWQVAPSWVVGVEGDWDWSRITGSTACPNNTFSCQSRIKGFSTARGRVGYTWDKWMLYATGGGAWGRVTIQTVDSAGPVACLNGATSATCGTTSTRNGWTAGLGVEGFLWQNVSGKLEWLHYDLGTGNFGVDALAANPVSSRQTGNMLRVGLDWHIANTK